MKKKKVKFDWTYLIAISIWSRWQLPSSKLDGLIGPIDNRPFNDQLTKNLREEEKNWHMICGMCAWQVLSSNSLWVMMSCVTWHHYWQTIRDWDLKFWDNVYQPLGVTCHMSHVHFSSAQCRIYLIERGWDIQVFSWLLCVHLVQHREIILQKGPSSYEILIKFLTVDLRTP